MGGRDFQQEYVKGKDCQKVTDRGRKWMEKK